MNMRKSIIDFNEKKGFICDMDGVIYHGNQILPGVPEFIQWLHDEKKEYLFLTNNSGYTPRELNQKLARMGLDVPEEHFYTSALATAAFLKEQAAGCSAFVIGHLTVAHCGSIPEFLTSVLSTLWSTRNFTILTSSLSHNF